MMMKNVWFAVTLLSVAFWTGCATGGGGHPTDKIVVTLSTPDGQNIVGVTLSVQITATVKNTDNTGVTWSLTQSGVACSPTCGTLSSSGLTATYTAPAAPPNPTKVDVTATSVVNTDKSDTLTLTVFPITVTVTPGPATVGVGLEQQFSAPVTPDQAPQTVTWQPLTGANCPAADCGTVNASGLYSAPDGIPSGGPFSLEAISSVDSPNWIGVATVTVVSSRLSGHYAFRFSGYDNANKPIAVAGAFVVDANGNITGGTQDELTAAGHNRCTILSSSSYAPANSNGTSHNSNNHGTLTLKTTSGACSVNTRSYKLVLRADGNGQMIEFDSVGRGSGRVSLASTSAFNNASLTGGFAFGLSGTDILNGKRAGSAGAVVANGTGAFTQGLLDINDGGVITSSSDVTGSYSIASDGTGTMTLIDNDHGAATYQFALYVVGGKTKDNTTPMTVYVISTDPLSNRPAVVGTLVFQDKTQTFDKSALDDFSVTNLTGVDSGGTHSQVSLTSARGDGNGNIVASYDANNAGTIVKAQTFNSTYSATGSGRYTVDWLSPAVHFVLYLTAANRGFLLQVGDAQHVPVEVYTGTMDPQPGSVFATAEMVGTLDAVTDSSGSPTSSQVAMNMLNSFATTTSYAVAGAQDEIDGGQNAGQTLAGSGAFDVNTSTGTITLTQPAATKYVVYPLDNPKPSFLIQHFEMIDVTSGQTDPTIIFGER